MARRCTSCGASVEVPPEVLATTCRFCDAALVDDDEAMSPVDKVVPFVLDAKRAGQELAAYLERQWLAPQRLRFAAKPTELRSVYVPCYAYEATTRSQWSARIGIEWQRTETYTTTDSDGKTVTKTRTVTEVEWFSESGSHGKSWVNHLVSASRGLDEADCNALEPFDLGAARAWSPELVAGNVAEHPTVPRDQAASTAHEELQQEAERAVKAFLPGDRQKAVSVQTQVSLGGVELVLLPVWMVVVREGETVLRMLVNGQTGEVVGDVPNSSVKLAVIAAVVLLLLAVVVYVAVNA